MDSNPKRFLEYFLNFDGSSFPKYFQRTPNVSRFIIKFLEESKKGK